MRRPREIFVRNADELTHEEFIKLLKRSVTVIEYSSLDWAALQQFKLLVVTGGLTFR